MDRRRFLAGACAVVGVPWGQPLPAVMLPRRMRRNGLVVQVTPTGQDVPSAGLTYENGFATPGYAMEWLAANVDCGNMPPCIVIDQGCLVVANAFSSVGLIHLRDVATPNGDWSAPTALPMITGGIGGVPIDPANWGERQPGPLISGDGINAVCGVGTNTVWVVRCMQVQSTMTDVVADRGAKINVACLAHGAFVRPYASPGKEAAEYGGSIENFGGCVVNAGGKYMWSGATAGQVIGVDRVTAVGPGAAPVYRAGVSFTNFVGGDATAVLSLPVAWRVAP